jgi:ferritin
MISKKVQDAINAQIRMEFDSAHAYLAMSAYFESINLAGCARWMRVQHQEELSHAMKLFDYLNARGGKVVLGGIDQPTGTFKSVRDVFQKVYDHEQKVSASINRLYELAVKEGDHATGVELQWFIREQVEEEKTAAGILEQVKVIGDHGISLLMLDRQLGARGSS